MAGDPRVRQLLDEILDSQRTPEEVCQACPELLPQVREGLRGLRAVEVKIDALFPTPGSTPSLSEPPEGEPPQFPGYEVQEMLGRGGMGVVYKAWDRRLNRSIALKILLAGAYARPGERERFLREAEAMARLRHPNIVQVYDVGDQAGRPYFTMEYIEGGNLAQKLSGTPCPARQAAALIATLAQAIQAAHQSGIIHRDLKPANVLLASDGTVKIADFGLAKMLPVPGAVEERMTQSGMILGTPTYIAPEQARGQVAKVGPTVDIYSLGAILYELLTGRPPFQGPSPMETLLQAAHQEPVPVTRLVPRVPRDLNTICLKCLEKDPAKRFASAGELAEDLGRFLNHETIRARLVGPLGRLARWGRRNPVPAASLTPWW